MLSAIFILNHKGETMISRIYREEITSHAIDYFRVNIINQRGFKMPNPVNRIDNYNFCHTSFKEGIWLVGVATSNVNVLMVFEFMKKIQQLIWSYCGSFTEEIILKNFVLIYEILDEICDYGYPQLTDAILLKNWVTQAEGKANKLTELPSTITNQITGQITWRKQGIRYSNNEMYMAITEKINLIVSTTGQPLSMSVDGSLQVKAFLSGMPECKCGINDKFLLGKSSKGTAQSSTSAKPTVAFDDCSFHQCVKLNNYEHDHSINFVPPDGKFELMRYRTTEDIVIPFRVIPIIKEINRLNLEINVVVKSIFDATLSGHKIEVVIPVPSTTINATIDTVKGKARYKMSENAIIWRIKSMPGSKEIQLHAVLDLQSSASSRATKEARAPITMKFEVPFSCSGMRVRYLKVFESKLNYTDTIVTKWVRYSSKEGEYEFRV